MYICYIHKYVCIGVRYVMYVSCVEACHVCNARGGSNLRAVCKLCNGYNVCNTCHVCLHVSMCVCVYVCVYVCKVCSVCDECDLHRERPNVAMYVVCAKCISLSLSLYIYIYMYMYAFVHVCMN